MPEIQPIPFVITWERPSESAHPQVEEGHSKSPPPLAASKRQNQSLISNLAKNTFASLSTSARAWITWEKWPNWSICPKRRSFFRIPVDQCVFTTIYQWHREGQIQDCPKSPGLMWHHCQRQHFEVCVWGGACLISSHATTWHWLPVSFSLSWFAWKATASRLNAEALFP